MNIKCDHCASEFEPFPVERGVAPNRWEGGFYCPHCGTWFHAYWIDQKAKNLLIKAQALLEYGRRKSGAASREGQVVLREYQRRMRWLNAKQKPETSQTDEGGRL